MSFDLPPPLKKEINSEMQPLKEVFGTKKESLSAAVNNKFTKINLKGLIDITEEELQDLDQKNPYIKSVIITSQSVHTFPNGFKNLESLDISHCTNLSCLPKLPKLKTLICIGCEKLSILPNGMKELRTLNIAGTPIIQLPNDMDSLEQLFLFEKQLKDDVLHHSIPENCEPKIALV